MRCEGQEICWIAEGGPAEGCVCAPPAGVGHYSLASGVDQFYRAAPNKAPTSTGLLMEYAPRPAIS